MGVEDLGSDSSPPVAMLFGLKIRLGFVLAASNLARQLVQQSEMPRDQCRGIHKMSVRSHHTKRSSWFRVL